MRRLIGLGMTMGILACGEGGDFAGRTASAVQEGTPEALGILDFLNAPSTSFTVLDVDAALDKRAARNLVNHRNGRDGRVGTSDDNLFDSMAEVDAVSYVGDSAIARLLEFADDNGWIQQGVGPMGVFDGVEFTHSEAQAVLQLVNSAPEAYLDVDVALDSRAVSSIVGHRPVGNLQQLAALSFVGKSALQKLKAAALVGGLGCAAPADCEAGLQCIGRPYDNTSALGRCVDTSPVPGEGQECDGNVACPADLVCVGAARRGEGVCAPSYVAGTFSSAESVAIPSDARSRARSSLVITGLASRPVDAILRMNLDHEDPENLRIELLTPDNRLIIVSDRDQNALRPWLILRGLSNAYANGTWTLVVRDYSNSPAGSLEGWSLELTTRF